MRRAPLWLMIFTIVEIAAIWLIGWPMYVVGKRKMESPAWAKKHRNM